MKLSRALQKGLRLLADPVIRRQALNAVDAYERLRPAECACCGFKGRFVSTGDAPVGSLCPACRSWDRHRLFALALERGFLDVTGRDVVNCGPETRVWDLVEAAQPRTHRAIAREVQQADEFGSIEALRLAPASVDVVIAIHSLEHVDDRRALAEVRRVLRPRGALVAMVPLIEGWATTYENPAIESGPDRETHFGHSSHLRWYGADFRERLAAAGFVLTEFTAEPADAVRYRLRRGEKVFLGRFGAVDLA